MAKPKLINSPINRLEVINILDIVLLVLVKVLSVNTLVH